MTSQRYFAISRGALFGLIVSWLAIIVLAVFLLYEGRELSIQSEKTKKVVTETCRAEKAIREALETFVLNQPNLDFRVVDNLQRISAELPSKCAP